MVFLFVFNVVLPRHGNSCEASEILTGTKGLYPVTGSMSACATTELRPHTLARGGEVELRILPSQRPSVDRQSQGYCDLCPGIFYKSKDRQG